MRLGQQIEIELATFETDSVPDNGFARGFGENPATVAATWATAEPTVAVETDFPDEDEDEVRIYNVERGRSLVAVIELVSPSNKDRAENRNSIVAKCAALLRKGVSVSIVDLVTPRQSNLYSELMAFLGQNDPTFGANPPAIFAAACRWRKGERRGKLETWSHASTVGQPLPLWFSPVLVVPLNLEASYEKTCDDLSTG